MSPPSQQPAQAGSLLVINAGSSSLKFSIHRATVDGDVALAVRGQIEGIGGRPRFSARNAEDETIADEDWSGSDAATLDRLLGWVTEWLAGEALLAVGHRVVHGGPDFAAPVLIDAGVLRELEALTPLAPLHQPLNLAPVKAIAGAHPDVPQVACFDTAFHRGRPAIADRLALPQDLHDAGVRRYGFHGSSYAYIARALKDVAPAIADGRVVIAHLGNGASMCAIRGGRSVETSMGFTALDGLVMGTRCGWLDPGVILHLIRERGMTAEAVENLLYHQSGLLGVSGISSDIRDLLASDDDAARTAIDLFVYRIGRELGALCAALGGLDALVFTAGIGENAVSIRERVCRDAAWLGIDLDAAANERGGPYITTADSTVSAWVVPTDEETMIALDTLRTVNR
ncbi:MAG: acetate/propionate family kinase [Pseudomonadota bacterium]